MNYHSTPHTTRIISQFFVGISNTRTVCQGKKKPWVHSVEVTESFLYTGRHGPFIFADPDAGIIQGS